MAPDAYAAVVTTYANTVIPIPQTTSGVYLNLETGAQGTSGSTVAGYDFNPYLAYYGTQLGFYWGPAATRGGGVAASATTGPYLDLATGTTISSASTFTAVILGTTGSPYLTDGIHTLGFKFVNAAGTTDYGYIQIQTTTGSTGYPATILGWVYDNTPGTAITVSAVPEPSSLAALALIGGAAGVRAWRRRKAA